MIFFFLHQKLVSVDQKERKEMQEELVLAESDFFFHLLSPEHMLKSTTNFYIPVHVTNCIQYL